MVLHDNQLTTNLADLISKLNTYLTSTIPAADQWQADRHVPASGEWAISKDDPGAGSLTSEVAFKWDTVSPSSIAVYQYHSALGEGNYVPGSLPHGQVGDSGCGASAPANDAAIVLERHVTITDTPNQYWVYVGEDADGDTYVHVVLKHANLIDYEHFGFGVLEKINDWTGGEYAYGFLHTPPGGQTSSVATDLDSTYLLDGLGGGSAPGPDMEDHLASVRVEGMTDSPASGLWGLVGGNHPAGSFGNDRQGTPRARVHMLGGFRGGTHAVTFAQFVGTTNLSFVPTAPVVVAHWDRDISGSSTQVDDVTPPMGVMKHVRAIVMRNFAPEQLVTIGSETWRVFPLKRKSIGGALAGTSGFSGIMYRES